MARADLVDRLTDLPGFVGIPRTELAWLVEHGTLEKFEAGTVVAPKGKPIETLWIILSGHISVQVDRGVGPRRVIGWRPGEVSGMLPYSRMTGPPGDNYLDETSELLTIHEKHFPAMINHCPKFTAYTVHLMLDRARRFNASDLQDEKMISLGKLAAGLAHELNNPASAAVRSAKLLLASLDQADAASSALGAADLPPDLRQMIKQVRTACMTGVGGNVLSPIQRSDREDELAEWLERHECDPGHADGLAETPITIETLDDLASVASGETLDTVLRWVAVGCQTHLLAADIEQATARIHELVAAVKRFTHMDSLSGPDVTDVETGLRDTVRVIASKAKTKSASVTLDIEPQLPPVQASGGELNQVWLNLVDNALDAIPESGHIHIVARKDLERVVVRVVDDGPGIPPDILPHIFDPFFTTKPPGQGTGLGLEITRRLVRRYHGDIAVESSPGRTEFRVSLVTDKTGSVGGRERSSR